MSQMSVLDMYDTLVVDMGTIMAEIRAEMECLELLAESDTKDAPLYESIVAHLKKYHDKMNEVL